MSGGEVAPVKKSTCEVVNVFAKWLYYLDSIAVLRAAFSMYERDVQQVDSPTHPAHPILLVVLSACTTLLIWAHFLYPKKSTILVTCVYIVAVTAYRFMVADSFLWPFQIPHFVAIFFGLLWLVCDGKQHHDMTNSCSELITYPSLTSFSSLRTKQLDSMEKGTQCEQSTELTTPLMSASD